ncbi:MAG: toprim domain-containing protein [Planctomycetes bacterium]|nr:toprim domain-containing protein [Planctomycetota bacterium]MCH9726981.1 toprim domain-containing protein [Planctomycetota bacterium]MCH9775229.1 toprim domain-containing protein [Planctomycetota bacterium]MCH9790018.1 toprim domain-containing protein [Planctomycetota bacterium]
MKSTPSQIENIIHQLQRKHIAKKLPMTRINTLTELLGNLDKVSESGDGWSSCCPNHPDSDPSLSVDIKLDGRIMVYCHRGCEFEDIVRSAGMLISDMFDTAPSTRSAVLPPRRIKDLAPRIKPVTRCWDVMQEQFQNQADAQSLGQLAEQLSVTVESLRSIGVGWCHRQNCWTFPERNGEQKICGFMRRYTDGKKLTLQGSQRGLTLPTDWNQPDQRLHICEGASDVAAAISCGWRAIGRPALGSGFDNLAILLKDEPAQIVMVADNDSEGVGRAGAEKLAQRLSNVLQKTVQTKTPPKQYKDLREYLTENNQ